MSKIEYLRSYEGVIRTIQIVLAFIGLVSSIIFIHESKDLFDLIYPFAILLAITLILLSALHLVHLLEWNEYLENYVICQHNYFIVLMTAIFPYSTIVLYKSASHTELIVPGVSGISLSVMFLIEGLQRSSRVSPPPSK